MILNHSFLVFWCTKFSHFDSDVPLASIQLVCTITCNDFYDTQSKMRPFQASFIQLYSVIAGNCYETPACRTHVMEMCARTTRRRVKTLDTMMVVAFSRQCESESMDWITSYLYSSRIQRVKRLCCWIHFPLVLCSANRILQRHETVPL
jgi:hypothetical protein